MRPARYILCFVCLIVLITIPAVAQETGDRELSEQRLRQLREQISEEQESLEVTRQAEEASHEQLVEINRQIALRTELIRSYRRRIEQISTESDSLRQSLDQLEGELDQLKSQYRIRAVHAYKYGRMHDLALILAAESINQMLIRINYLRRFAQKRQEQLNEIAQAGQVLTQRRNDLSSILDRNQELLSDTENEQENLEELQDDRRRIITRLQAERSNLEASISEKESAVAELLEIMARAAETGSNSRRVREAADPNLAGSSAGMSLSDQGRLPWPADGAVVEPFGDIVNPVYGTTTPNPGILIGTTASAEVRAVFDGQVVELSILPDFGTYMSVEHGDYQSVYSNFSMTYVTEGQQVSTGQVIGRAGTDGEPKGRAVFFGLFFNGEAIDPVPWLQDR